MRDLLVALGLVAFLEGALLALGGKRWLRMVEQISALPDRNLRFAGLAVAIAGLLWIAIFLD